MSKALFELEHLVMTGGDPKRIKQLRVELGIERQDKPPSTKPKRTTPTHVAFHKKFDVEKYLAMKESGMADKEIAADMGVSYSTLKIAKDKHDIIMATRRPVNMKDENRERLVMLKLKSQKTIETHIVMDVIQKLHNDNEELRKHIKLLEKRLLVKSKEAKQ